MPELRRVGHKGADLIAPGNTYASFDAALAAGVDMIEFDVLPDRENPHRLLLAHDYHDVARRDPLTLEEGLTHLASDAFEGIEFDVDLKLPGYELRVVEALRAQGILGRALISTQYRESLALYAQVGDKAQEISQNLPALQQKVQEAKPQASRAAWVTFGALLLSLAAAVLGALAGRRRAPRGPYPSSTGT